MRCHPFPDHQCDMHVEREREIFQHGREERREKREERREKREEEREECLLR